MDVKSLKDVSILDVNGITNTLRTTWSRCSFAFEVVRLLASFSFCGTLRLVGLIATNVFMYL